MSFLNRLFGKKGKSPVAIKHSKVDYNKYFDSSVVDGITIELLYLGELKISTGKIIACDPLVFLGETEPFTRTIKPGIYPVVVCVAETESSGDRYAIAKLELVKKEL